MMFDEKMKIVHIKEYEQYSEKYILDKLENNNDFFNELIKHAIIVSEDGKFKFSYVGLIIIGNKYVINCYPKYIPNENNIKEDFKQVLKVIRKYIDSKKKFNRKYLTYQTGDLEINSFDLLSLMLFFIEDYYENGVYSNIQNILEINGNGEINWDKTINDTYPFIRNNNPFYAELHTRYKINDLNDYFRLLHEYIITECSINLKKADLLDYFDLTPVELSDKTLYDFGDKGFILKKLEKELNMEFNTHKRKLLRAMHSYLSSQDSFTNKNSLILYGVYKYEHIWEEMCSQVLNNILDDKFRYLIKSEDKLAKRILDLISSNEKYNLDTTLHDLIEKPKWVSDEGFKKCPNDTYIPDIISFFKGNFIILDAKYYDLTFEREKVLSGQPGIESISKQYFYELAFKDFFEILDFKNAFLFPTYCSEVENKGYVELEMLSNLQLQNIQIIMLPANKINEFYLNNEKMDISELDLDKYNQKPDRFNKIGGIYCFYCGNRINRRDKDKL